MELDSAAAVVIPATLALIGIFIERLTSRVSDLRSNRQRGLEEWLSSLASWVDELRDAPPEVVSDSFRKRYQQLTNRQVLELRFKRRDRFVAWWMHEMVVEIADKTQHEEGNQQRDQILSRTGENLLAWHHRKLKSRDFFIPYALNNLARNENTTVDEVAASLGLTSFKTPAKRTFKRRRELLSVLGDPKQGALILERVGRFIDPGPVFSVLPIIVMKAETNRAKAYLIRLQWVWLKFRRLLIKKKLERANRRFASLTREHDIASVVHSRLTRSEQESPPTSSNE